MTLASRITATRKARGMTMSALAKLCGVSTTAVSNWEAGNTAPREDSLAAIARSLGVTEHYLVKGSAPAAKDVKGILEAAKQQIADALGVTPDQVRLNFSLEA